jgi:hypothetical protein
MIVIEKPRLARKFLTKLRRFPPELSMVNGLGFFRGARTASRMSLARVPRRKPSVHCPGPINHMPWGHWPGPISPEVAGKVFAPASHGNAAEKIPNAQQQTKTAPEGAVSVVR